MTVEVGVNRRAGTGQSVTAAVFIVIAAGSIAVIPLLAANLDRRALGLAACVLTLVFWVGFIGAICCVGEIVNTPTRAFLLTSDWQLYYVHFAARDYGPAPVRSYIITRCSPRRKKDGNGAGSIWAARSSAAWRSSTSRECGRIRWGA